MILSRFKAARTGVLAAAAVLLPLSSAPAQTASAGKMAMQSWQDARFGMFVHWGVYSVPAGVYNGKPVAHLGEWIMANGRIPKEDYRKYADRLAPNGYDPGEWLKLANEAGMKYMVVTAKHHDGFALFDSKVSDWDAVDATPAHKDLLMPLVEACRKANMPLGFHYSQAQDWWHAGGGKYGKSWDEAQNGSYDDYLEKVAVPQIKELLKNYGPVASFFFDTPVGMNRARGEAIENALPPTTLTNDRLYPGYDGRFKSFENQLPRELMVNGPWELCLSLNDTWGYKSADQNWKSSSSLLRLLSETASRGGNMLLNVGPDADGKIPEPATRTLREIGRWLSVNGEAIYGTQRSPFAPIPWNGGCTRRVLESGDTELYVHLYEWPENATVRLPGLANEVLSATLLSGGKIGTTRVGNSWHLQLPAQAPAEMVPVVKLTLKGALVLEPPSTGPDQAGKLALSCTTAILTGNEIRLERQAASPQANLGYWTDTGDTASWSITLPEAGTYQMTWNLACAPGSEGSIVALMQDDREVGRFEVPSTGEWSSFRIVPGGKVSLPAGSFKFRLVPFSKAGLGIMNLRSVSLEKVR